MGGMPSLSSVPDVNMIDASGTCDTDLDDLLLAILRGCLLCFIRCYGIGIRLQAHVDPCSAVFSWNVLEEKEKSDRFHWDEVAAKDVPQPHQPGETQ